MLRSLLFFVGLGLFTTDLAWAQAPAEPNDGRPRQRQIGRRGEPERRFENRFDRMADALALDASQRVQFDQIVAPHRERMKQRGEKFRALRDAEDAGDTEQTEQLRTELRDAGGEGGQPRGEMMDEVAAQVEAILRPDQVEQFQEMRNRMRERWSQGQQQREMIAALPDRLNLDDAQRTDYRQMVRAQFRERRRRAETVQEMGDQAGGALEQGDTQSAANLREEIEANRNPDADVNEFLTKVEAMLNEEQKPLLAQYREELASATAGDAAGGVGSAAGPNARAHNIRNLFRAVRRLNLNAGQEDQVREFEREAMRAQREIRNRDEEARAALFSSTRQKVDALLTAEQKTELDSQLQRARGGRR